MLENHFKLKILGDLRYFLGLEIAKSEKGIHLCKRKYALQLLNDIGFTVAKPASIPMDPGNALNDRDGELLTDVTEYRRLVGRLNYLTISRPAITYSVNKLSQFVSKPRLPHLQALHHLLRYIKATAGQGIFFPAVPNLKVSAYVDADWGSCSDSRKSTTGFCVYLGHALISWKSKKQVTVARSSAEAEYRALTTLTSELLWVKQLLRAFEIPTDGIMVFCDSQAAIQMANNPTCNQRSKHIDIDCHFLREHVQSKFLELIHVASQDQLVDAFTKPLHRPLFSSLISKMGTLDIGNAHCYD
jgi:hypothetical protein